MSILSALPEPLKLVLKPGIYQSGNTRGGLNINNWMKNFLKRIGFAETLDCCVYYPTLPTLTVVDPTAPTAGEALAAGVPPGGMFKTTDGTDYISWMVDPSGTPVEIFTTV